MDSTKLPFFRIVRHKRIKLKKSIRDELLNKLTLRTTSCLNRCDNYYFSPSQISLVSPLPQFKFKTHFNYNSIKIINKTINKTKPQKKLLAKHLIDSKNNRNNDFNNKVKQLLTPFRLSDNQLINNDINNDLQSVDDFGVSPIVRNNININNNYMNDNNENNENISFPFLRSNSDSRSNSIVCKHKYLYNLSAKRVISESSGDYPKSVSTTTATTDKNSTDSQNTTHSSKVLPPKTSTPITQSMHPLIDPSLSRIIVVNKELRKTFRSVSIQMNPSKVDKTTQTVDTSDKWTQTENQTQDKCIQMSTNDNSITTLDNICFNNESDSDPESPFPKRLSQEIFNKTKY